VEPARRSLVACMLVVVASLALGRSAHAEDSAPPVADPGERTTFEEGLGPWRGHRASVSVVRTRLRGRAAQVSARNRGLASFAILRRAVLGAESGVTYRATGWAQARSGVVCLRLREVAGVRTVRHSTRCVRLDGRWRRLPVVSLTKAGAHTGLSVTVYKRKARKGKDGFLVDGVEVTPAPVPSAPPTQPPPPGEAPPDDPPPQASGPAFGTQFHCMWGHYSNAQRTAVLDKLAAAGVSWVRLDVGWYGIEDTHKGARNSWYLGTADFCVNQARARGLKVLVTLWATPGWANGGGAREKPPTNPNDYADFARFAAEHFRGRVDAWEVWNEPDPWQAFFTGTTAQYVNLLKAAYPALKDGDPSAKVVLGGPSSNDAAWISQVYSLGAKNYFDVMATHPYQGIADAPPEQPTDGNRWWFTQTPAVRNVMLANGDGAKPIWFTEYGWSAHANWAGVPNWERGVTAQQQGDYLVRSLEYAQAHWPYVEVMFWYKERANPSVQSVHLEGYALLNTDLSERPAYGALKSYLTG
jgi:hypothetical protein